MAGAVFAVVEAMVILGDARGPAEPGFSLLAVSALGFAAATLLRRPALPRWPAAAREPAPARDSPLALVARGALAAVCVFMVIELANQMERELPPYPVQVGAWAMAVTLFVVALAPPGAWASAWANLRESWRAQRPAWRIVLVCTGAALALRLVALENALPLIFGDEAPFGRDAIVLLNGARVSLFAPGHQGHPWLFPALQALPVWALGRSLTALRLLPALVGALTVPATYLLARELCDRRTAAAAAAFLATYPVHVHFSRLGLNNIFDPFFAALSFGLLLRGLRRGDRLSFAAAGAALGLGQYFYSSGRLLLALAAGLLLWLALTRWSLVRRRWQGLAAMLATAAVTVWPVFHHLYTHGIALVFRAPYTSVIMAPPGHIPDLQLAVDNGMLGNFVAHQLRYAFLGYIHIPDHFHFYGGGTAMLLPPAAAAFLLGVMWALRRWAHPPEALLLAWIGLTALLGGALLTNPPGYARYVIATPALAVVAAMGLVRTVDYLVSPPMTPSPALAGRRRLARALVAAFAALLVAVNTVYYFALHLGDLRDEIPRVAWELDDLRRQIAALPPETGAYIISDEVDAHGHAALHYFASDRIMGYYQENPVDWARVVSELARGEDLVLFIASRQLAGIDQLAALLPGGTLCTPTTRLPLGVPYTAFRVWLDPES